MLVKDLIKALDRNEKLEVLVSDAINYAHKRFIANAESEETLSKDIIDPEPLETLLQISNEKVCCVNDNAFGNIDNDIAICSQATVKALTAEFLEEKQNSSGEDSGVENMDQTPPNKTETIEALEKVRQYLTSIQGITDEEFKALSALEKKVTISSNQQLHQSTLLDYFNVPK
ncbi:hypothetical protein AVEN_256859-1 [Araneus ventricosus]|uniref:Uncharacterized protein n=1 Tax=Araneus ventricosus TaxID=182803 RepID=A0A4Y2EU31_ARAVE|nr:hypothetical protein AVEN_256859-1 [Araneus ventricosus]